MQAPTKKRFLTGDRPTGPLHLGHYVGSLQNRVALQNAGNDGFIVIADYQVITDRLETETIEQNIFEIVKDYIAVGIDPKKTTIFVQSHVPEIAELTFVFSMLVTLPQIERNPTVKEEIRAMGLKNKLSLGMFSYPVSQAADILLFKPDFIPVGVDQAPHIELSREIAGRFNRVFGDIFPIPELMLSNIPRLVGLDGDQKMSKSRGNAINLSDSPETVEAKIKKAVTDSYTTIEYNLKERPIISNLLLIYSVVTGRSPDDIVKDYENKGYRELKEGLIQAITEFLTPIQKNRNNVSDKDVANIIKSGTEKTREIAIQTMKEVRSAMKFEYPRIF